MLIEDFNTMVDAIMDQGYSEKDAASFAAIIGDTPVLDEDGLWLVLGDDGEILARLQPLDK